MTKTVCYKCGTGEINYQLLPERNHREIFVHSVNDFVSVVLKLFRSALTIALRCMGLGLGTGDSGPGNGTSPV